MNSNRSITPLSAGMLSPFPSEILALIFIYLPPSAICSCLRVNSSFYAASIRFVYRRLHLAEHIPFPSFADRKITGPFGKAKQPKKILSKRWRAKVVENVTIDSHSSSWCAPIVPGDHSPHLLPQLPRLAVLRIFMTSASGPRLFHADGREQRSCHVLDHLRPPKLVIRNAPILYDTVPVWAFPIALWATVRHYVCVMNPDIALVGSNFKSESPGCGAAGLLASIPPNATEATIVFWTPRPEVHWRPLPRPIDSVLSGLPSSSFEATWAGRLFSELADGFRHSVIGVTFVNVGSLDRHAVREAEWDMHVVQHKVEEYFRNSLGRGLDVEERGTRQKKEYLTRLRWRLGSRV